MKLNPPWRPKDYKSQRYPIWPNQFQTYHSLFQVQLPNCPNMKFTLFFAVTALSGLVGVMGTPTPGSSGVTKYSAPANFKPYDVDGSVDPNEGKKPSTADTKSAAAAQYWVCEAVSSSTGHYGWAQGKYCRDAHLNMWTPLTQFYGWSSGGSEASALKAAKQKCGKGDCNSYSCIEEGCVGLDFGSHSFSLSYARGFGKNDGPKAASKASSECKKFDAHCAKAGYFCAKYIR